MALPTHRPGVQVPEEHRGRGAGPAEAAALPVREVDHEEPDLGRGREQLVDVLGSAALDDAAGEDDGAVRDGRVRRRVRRGRLRRHVGPDHLPVPDGCVPRLVVGGGRR